MVPHGTAMSPAVLGSPSPAGRHLGNRRTEALLALQQTLGNQAVQRIIQRTKSANTPTTPKVEDGFAARLRSAASGNALEPSVRSQLEQKLGTSLSIVRLHTDTEADKLTREVDATAFTTGSDIFFRSGTYDPTSTEGMRTLMHEAVHVIQQAAGPVSGTAEAEGVSISDPSDAYEQSAQSFVMEADKDSATSASIQPKPASAIQRQVAGTLVLQREGPAADDKKPPKPDPATLSNPFEAPAVKVEVEKLAVDRLRELTGTLVNQRYAGYLNAIDSAAREIEKEKKEQEERDKFMVNAVLTIGFLASGPAVAAVANGISGDKLLTRLKDGVASNGPRFLKIAGVEDAKAAEYLTNEAYQKVSGDTLKGLAEKFNTEKATKAVETARDKLKDKAVELAATRDKWACGAAYLDALKDSADNSSVQLLQTIQGMNGYDELLGIYNAFDAMSLSKFRQEVTVQAHNFMEQVAPLLAEKAGANKAITLFRVNAWGQPRLVLARYGQGYAMFNNFVAWITPDMEQTAIASYGTPQEVPASSFDRLPEPTKEKGKQQIVNIDAWGKNRLAVVEVKDAGFFTTELYYDFVRWIPDSERAEMEARAQGTQIGGLMTLAPSDVKNLKAPAD
jgi:hypothetical protein